MSQHASHAAQPNEDAEVDGQANKPMGDKFDSSPRKFNKGKLLRNFIDGAEMAAKFEGLINQVLEVCLTEVHIDRVYENRVDTYLGELNKCLEELDWTPKSKRLARHSSKPWWDGNLTTLWKTCHEAEKAFLKLWRHSRGGTDILTLDCTSTFCTYLNYEFQCIVNVLYYLCLALAYR